MFFTNYKMTLLAVLLFFVAFVFAQTNRVESLKVKNLFGQETELRPNSNGITILNFWATWNASSLREMPNFEKIYQEFLDNNDRVKIIGIAVMSDSAKIGKMLNLTKVHYPNYIGTRKQLFSLTNNLSIPQTIILDNQGQIIQKWNGEQNYKVLLEYVLKYLNHSKLSRRERKLNVLTRD